MREVLVGFDSAWTDSSQNPGAVAACIIEHGRNVAFYPPRLATFADVLTFLGTISSGDDLLLIAIDQPTIIPNYEGCRPVDRVAGSLISMLGGGVQPARRGGLGRPLFGDGAPIWKFLAAIDAIQNPIEARSANSGRFLMEVFPALALPALVPAIWERRRAAKYNPASPKFSHQDWRLVASGVSEFAGDCGSDDLARWLCGQAALLAPRKADQDRLDAAICLAIAIAWRQKPSPNTLQIGDDLAGYMVTIVSSGTRAVLIQAAENRGVPVEFTWNASAVDLGRPLKSACSVASELELSQAIVHPGQGATKRHANPFSDAPAIVDAVWLRDFLIEFARNGICISYGEVAVALGHRWSQGFGVSLTRALDKLAVQNTERGEPLLMCLVVNKASRLPGIGFFAHLLRGSIDGADQRRLFEQEVERCRAWAWR